ncbi:MAG: MFS transporter [Chloroflexota bacterium]
MKKYYIFATVCMGLLLTSTSNSMASVALSTIMKDLNTTLILAGWVISGFSLVHTVAMPLMGKISDMLGRKRTFIAYMVVFLGGSILCALSSNIYFLIGSRIFTAFGAAGLMPCAASLVHDEFPKDWPRYIGLFSSVFPIGMIIGPNIGGWIVQAFGWRYMFWFNLPFGAIVLLASVLLLPKKEDRNGEKSIDLFGAGLLFSSIFSFMLGLSQLKSSVGGISWALVGGLCALAIGLFITFLWWERRVKSPIIDLSILSRGPFLAANLYNFFYGMGGLGVLSLIPLYAVSVYKMSVLQSGLLMTPRSVTMIVASGLTSFIMTRTGYFKPIMFGTITLVAGLLLLSLQPQGIAFGGVQISVVVLLVGIVGLCGLGSGTATPASNNACLELMPDKIATISGIRGMFRSLGSTMGVSIATVILNNIESVQQGWFVVYMVSAILVLLSTPAVFRMTSFVKLRAPAISSNKSITSNP